MAHSDGPFDPSSFPVIPDARIFGVMTNGANPIDRLLPRHEAAPALELSWNLRMARKRLLGKEEAYSHAMIQDLSLEGALVEVPASQVHELGTRVHLRFRGAEGHAVICHRREGREGYFLYGIRFLPDPAFGSAIISAVGEVRGKRAELDLAWNRPN